MICGFIVCVCVWWYEVYGSLACFAQMLVLRSVYVISASAIFYSRLFYELPMLCIHSSYEYIFVLGILVACLLPSLHTSCPYLASFVELLMCYSPAQQPWQNRSVLLPTSFSCSFVCDVLNVSWIVEALREN